MLQALGFGMLDENGNQVEFGAKGLRQLKSITTSHVLPELQNVHSVLPAMSQILFAESLDAVPSTDRRRVLHRR